MILWPSLSQHVVNRKIRCIITCKTIWWSLSEHLRWRGLLRANQKMTQTKKTILIICFNMLCARQVSQKSILEDIGDEGDVLDHLCFNMLCAGEVPKSWLEDVGDEEDDLDHLCFNILCAGEVPLELSRRSETKKTILIISVLICCVQRRSPKSWLEDVGDEEDDPGDRWFWLCRHTHCAGVSTTWRLRRYRPGQLLQLQHGSVVEAVEAVVVAAAVEA